MQHPHAANRDEKSEAGFTLIELMMVVLIIAILIAVLIPTFVGAKQRAQDRAMQSSMRNALTAAKVVYSDHADYTQATVAGLTAAEPSLTFVAAAIDSPGPNVVSVNPASANVHRAWRASRGRGSASSCPTTRAHRASASCTPRAPGAELQRECVRRLRATRVGRRLGRRCDTGERRASRVGERIDPRKRACHRTYAAPS